MLFKNLKKLVFLTSDWMNVDVEYKDWNDNDDQIHIGFSINGKMWFEIHLERKRNHNVSNYFILLNK